MPLSGPSVRFVIPLLASLVWSGCGAGPEPVTRVQKTEIADGLVKLKLPDGFERMLGAVDLAPPGLPERSGQVPTDAAIDPGRVAFRWHYGALPLAPGEKAARRADEAPVHLTIVLMDPTLLHREAESDTRWVEPGVRRLMLGDAPVSTQDLPDVRLAMRATDGPEGEVAVVGMHLDLNARVELHAARGSYPPAQAAALVAVVASTLVVDRRELGYALARNEVRLRSRLEGQRARWRIIQDRLKPLGLGKISAAAEAYSLSRGGWLRLDHTQHPYGLAELEVAYRINTRRSGPAKPMGAPGVAFALDDARGRPVRQVIVSTREDTGWRHIDQQGRPAPAPFDEASDVGAEQVVTAVLRLRPPRGRDSLEVPQLGEALDLFVRAMPGLQKALDEGLLLPPAHDGHAP